MRDSIFPWVQKRFFSSFEFSFAKKIQYTVDSRNKFNFYMWIGTFISFCFHLSRLSVSGGGIFIGEGIFTFIEKKSRNNKKKSHNLCYGKAVLSEKLLNSFFFLLSGLEVSLGAMLSKGKLRKFFLTQCFALKKVEEAFVSLIRLITTYLLSAFFFILKIAGEKKLETESVQRFCLTKSLATIF